MTTINGTDFDLTDETTRKCEYCGGVTVEKFSERRATIDPLPGGGRFFVHPTATRVGDGEILGREECSSGRMRWGYR